MTLDATFRNSGLTRLLAGVRPSNTSRGGFSEPSLRSRSARLQSSSPSSFSALVATAQSSTSASKPAVVRSTPQGYTARIIQASPLQSTASLRGAEITSSSAATSAGQGLVFTPLGIFDPINRAPFPGQTSISLAAVEDGKGNLNKSYFLTAYPGEYMKNEQKMVRFAELFGIKATRMLEGFGAVEGHCIASFQPTSDQASVYNDEGNRAWYSAMDLMDIMPENRAALGIDLSGHTQASLLDLYRTNPNFKFYTAGSTPVIPSLANLGRA